MATRKKKSSKPIMAIILTKCRQKRSGRISKTDTT